MDNAEAVAYLQTLLNRQLRIHTTDTRMFIGQMKCTDKDRNIILAGTHEYRPPPASVVMAAVEQSTETGTTTINMMSRFVGLVVVPGAYITKIEVEQVVGAETPATRT